MKNNISLSMSKPLIINNLVNQHQQAKWKKLNQKKAKKAEH